MRSFDALQKESQVALNTVDSIDSFIADINAGRWDQVLPAVAQLRLPLSKLAELYEQVMSSPDQLDTHRRAASI